MRHACTPEKKEAHAPCSLHLPLQGVCMQPRSRKEDINFSFFKKKERKKPPLINYYIALTPAAVKLLLLLLPVVLRPLGAVHLIVVANGPLGPCMQSSQCIT
jgi:hypothetical protein